MGGSGVCLRGGAIVSLQCIIDIAVFRCSIAASLVITAHTGRNKNQTHLWTSRQIVGELQKTVQLPLRSLRLVAKPMTRVQLLAALRADDSRQTVPGRNLQSEDRNTHT